MSKLERYEEIINQGHYYHKPYEEIMQALSANSELSTQSLAMMKTLYPEEYKQATGEDMKANTDLTKAQYGTSKKESEALKLFQDTAKQYKEALDLGENGKGFAGKFSEPERLGKLEGLQADLLVSAKEAFTLGTLDEGVLQVVAELTGEKPKESWYKPEGYREQNVKGKLDTLINQTQKKIDMGAGLRGEQETRPTPEDVKQTIDATIEYARNNPDDPQAQQFMKDWENHNISLETGEIINKSEEQMTPFEREEAYRESLKPIEEPDAFTKFGQDLAEIPGKTKERATGGMYRGATIPTMGPMSPELQVATAGAVGDVIGAVGSLVTPDSIEKGVSDLVAKGLDNDLAKNVMNTWSDFEQSNPRLARDIANMGIAGDWILGSKGLSKIGSKAVTKPLKEMSKEAVTKSAKKLVRDTTKKHAKQLKNVTNSTSVMRDVRETANKAGMKNIEEDVVKTGLLKNTVNEKGTIITKGDGGAVQTYKKTQIDPISDSVAKGLEQEGKTISVEELKKATEKAVKANKTKLSGTAGKKAIKKAEAEIDAQAEGRDVIPLSEVHYLKTSIYDNINFDVKDVAQGDTTTVKALKKIIEDTSDSVEVKKLNKELQEKYIIKDYLEKLDGRKVDNGKLGIKFAEAGGTGTGTMVGMALGSPFGPIGMGIGGSVGSIIGQQTGKRVAGQTLKRTFTK